VVAEIDRKTRTRTYSYSHSTEEAAVSMHVHINDHSRRASLLAHSDNRRLDLCRLLSRKGHPTNPTTLRTYT